MILLFGNDDAACGVGVPVAVVAHERSAEHILAPANLLAVDLVGQRSVKAVVARPDGDDGLAGIDILHDQFPFRHREREQAGKENDEVGRGELLQTGNVMLFERLTFLRVNRHRRIDFALLVHREQHGAVEAVMCAENLRHHRH